MYINKIQKKIKIILVLYTINGLTENTYNLNKKQILDIYFQINGEMRNKNLTRLREIKCLIISPEVFFNF